MPTPTFPYENIGTTSRHTRKYRTLMAGFGDGYDQVVPDGVNTLDEEWDLSYNDYPKVDILNMRNFLDARRGVESFLWTPPFEDAPKKWRQTGDIIISFSETNAGSIQFTVKRVYTP